MITFENYYIKTFGIFKACKEPIGEPDYISFKTKYIKLYSEDFEYDLNKNLTKKELIEIFSENFENILDVFVKTTIGNNIDLIVIKIKSNEISSAYWFGENSKGKYIIRFSNHWSEIVTDKKPLNTLACKAINSCYWVLSNPKFSKNYGKIYLNKIKKR